MSNIENNSNENTKPLSEGTLKLISDMLEREESYANDYHQDEDDLISWAREIDLCRSEVGLPLVVRMVSIDPYVTERQTMEESLRLRHIEKD